jgi:MraZ protein
LGENGLFLGQHHLALDKEDRLLVPSRFYGPLSDGGVITQGFDRNLWIIPAAKFQLLCQQISAVNLADPKARLLLRILLGQACELVTDNSGSIQIPQNLRAYAKLDKQIVLVGQGDYFEIWDKTLWQGQESQLGDANANSERFANLVISLSAP